MFSFQYNFPPDTLNLIDHYEAQTRAAHQTLTGEKMPMTGWLQHPARISEEELSRITETAAQIRDKNDAFVLIGIGGSYIGARACIELLDNHNANKNIDFYYAGFNLSGAYHSALKETLHDKDFTICVVSKSGTTMETAMTFTYFKTLLKERYGARYAEHIYVVTDEMDGLLRREAEEEGYTTFALDKNIGGRYSVLTSVGLLPAAVAGYDINKIIAGAQAAIDAFGSSSLNDNDCLKYAVLRRIAEERLEKHIEIFSAFEPRFSSFLEWLKQLFGESEGKDQKGIYPTSLLYTRDLHAMGQFLQQGRPGFFESIFSVRPKDHAHPFDIQNDIVCRAVKKARADNSTPICTFYFDEINEYAFGYAAYFFEKACAVSCLLTGVNPFDQPGVEVYKAEVKRLSKELLQNDPS